ncbi:MAG: phosphoribosyl-AMP cyclohydrolase [Anaerolineae bacterium]
MQELSRHIAWNPETGLVPVIVQDEGSGEVLMLAYANAEALAETLQTGLGHFWSRSRNRLWRKGETSGNALHVVEVRVDCDADALLYRVQPRGPACHTGMRTCFYRTIDELGEGR